MRNPPEQSSTIILSDLTTVTGGTVKPAPPCHQPPPCHTSPAPAPPATHCRWPFGDWGHGGPTFNFPTYPWWNNGHPIETAAGSTRPTR